MKKTADALIDGALKDDLAFRLVESLTTEVGPRLAGSAQEARARDWAVRKLKELGFRNVHVEPFKVRRWTRGAEYAAITSPFPQKLHVTALGNSAATPKGGVEAEIVRFETLTELEAAPATGLKGKIVFVDEKMPRTQNGAGYGLAVAKRSGAAVEAGRRGAVAAIIRSAGTDQHRNPHTGAMRYEEGVTPVPIGAISNPDADQLARALKRGPVHVRLMLDVKGGGHATRAWEGAPSEMADSGNVIAEIPGQTDEIIIVGAHLDSWDLATGAVDDGAGVGIVTAAAKMVGDLPGKPKRTIRVVLFGSEEFGLVGARAYVQAHKDEMDKHIVGAESDFGAGRIWRMQTGWGEDKLPRAAPFLRVLRRLGVTQGDNNGSGGSDMSLVHKAGTPGVSFTQDGTDYFDLHHTPDDTLDKIDPDALAQNVAVYAAFIYLASELPGDFRGEEGEKTAAAGE